MIFLQLIFSTTVNLSHENVKKFCFIILLLTILSDTYPTAVTPTLRIMSKTISLLIASFILLHLLVTKRHQIKSAFVPYSSKKVFTGALMT